MANNKLKRKLVAGNQKAADEVSEKIDTAIIESGENSTDEELLNTIESEVEDSSDSEAELEESEDEVDEYPEEESENSDEDVSGNSDEEDSEEELEGSSEEELEESTEEEENDSDSEQAEISEKEIIEKKEKPSTSNQKRIDHEKGSSKRKESNKKNNIIGNEITEKKLEKTETVPDEYQYDSSDEEDIRNTCGNIPKNWYDEYSHFGYDWEGKKLIKPQTGDMLDEFLKRVEDPDFWRTVKDPQTGQNVVLSDEDIKLIKRIKAGKIPDANFDEYAPWVEWFTSEVMKTPLRNFPEHKRSFLPSKDEERKVSKLVHALKMGWIKTREEAARLRAKKEPQYYMLWKSDDQAEEMRRIYKHIPAPKRLLPGHSESYNPPPEYLFDEREMKQWNKFKDTPWKRKSHFVPQKFDSLRKVPSYKRYVRERFLRCLDLYLCPRAIKMKINIEPEALVPKLPSPKDLQPFPNVLSRQYKGHEDMIRTISTDKSGKFLLSGSDDGTVKIWEVCTARCLKTIKTDDVVRSVEWCPNAGLSLILVASGKRVLLINPHVGDAMVASKTDSVLFEAQSVEAVMIERVRTTVQWSLPEDELYKRGVRIVLTHFKEVSQVTWHGKGDYFATVMPDGQNRSVVISQISQRRSQLPLSKPKGLIQCVLFHPTKPCLFVATQRHVRIYDLVKQTLVKKLMTNCKWISTMAIHPGGDNLLVGTYDRKVLWFDLDLSTKPYQVLRLHGTAVRGVAFHKRYPLFASGSDDKSLIVSHGMVYNDLLQNPLIVPLKRLEDHKQYNDFGIFGVHFHPMEPWVFSSGADGTINLYTH
ncbi:ribosome biogenesis protein BOP1 homolog [Harmonia axyridis]|uniref:ribosome biogenesis protein BOP1 homolog n=1 Tax=Harmonia axyridis TaxID=115357 RepID=UPI001E27606F|nr:ribosome biogenesis protein BOP1 homolog [Harmonia axyridis]